MLISAFQEIRLVAHVHLAKNMPEINCLCGEPMGLGLTGSPKAQFRRKYQWLVKVRGINDDPDNGIVAFPHRRSARPNIAWKEYEFQHLNESVHFPLKPVWETIDFVLYDVIYCDGKKRCNPIFDWLRASLKNTDREGFPEPGLYDPETGSFRPVVSAQIKRTGDIYILSGEGRISEHWVLENCYPQHVRFGEMDMDSSDVITIDVSLRYDRAYCVLDF